MLKKKKPKRKNKQTQTAKQKRDRSVLKNQHRDILAKKKKKKPKRKNKKETDWCLSERSELVGLAWSELVGMGLNRSSELWIGAAVDRCL